MLTVNAVNDPPTISTISNQSTAEDTPTSAIAFTVGDLETAPGSLTVTGTSSNMALVPTANIVFGGNAANRTVTLNPAANQLGVTTITLTVSDGLLSATTSFQLSVLGGNDGPIAAADEYTLDEDTTLTVPLATGILANDVDLDGDVLSATLMNAPMHGTLDLEPDGSFTYVPDKDYTGTDTFTYTASDGALSSAEATVTLTITSVNDDPEPSDDTYAVLHGQTLTTMQANGVLANDTDVDGDTLTAELAVDVAEGTLTFNADGTFTYTPDADFIGSDSFTYTVSDGQVTSAPTTVTLIVSDTDDDGDGVPDLGDNCPEVSNADQADLDLDEIGDVCDADKDGDGLDNDVEIAFGFDPLAPDSDGDTIGDAAEFGAAEKPTDTDSDGIYDGLDKDADGDTISDADEAGDAVLSTPPVDTDGDGTPDFQDVDTDGDGVPDSGEVGDTDLATPPVDTDGDAIPDYRDLDADGDGTKDDVDNCRLQANPTQEDANRNGVGDACDMEGGDNAGGCGCRVGAPSHTGGALPPGAFVLLAWALRRLRRARPSAA